MKSPNTQELEPEFGFSPDLLNGVRRIRESVGEGLNDQEFTQLLHGQMLSPEAGFYFLNFTKQFVTLSVPPQELAGWYPEKGWIAADKERIAQEIAAKHGLTVWEPPDLTPKSTFPPYGPDIRHHIEFNNRWEIVVVAHPYYLKVRLLSVRTGMLHLGDIERPLQLKSNLLQDLSALYHKPWRDSETTSLKPGAAIASVDRHCVATSISANAYETSK